MAKDPAVLFYYQDFLVGTEFMTDEEVGKYIRILCHQADKGRLSKQQVLSICKASAITKSILEKLRVDESGLYYNERMETEKEKRRNFAESRRNNAKSIKAYAKHMENENENINKDINEDKNKEMEDCQNLWNQFASENSLTTIQKITNRRESGIKQRLQESEFNLFKIFEMIKQSDFLLGKNNKGWKVDFDFVFLSPHNYIKILEGKYNGRKDGGASPSELAAIVARRYEKEQH